MSIVPLSARHRSELAASAITPERMDARGYVTITDPKALPSAFEGKTRVAGLLMPIRNTQGECVAWQLKPDAPWFGKDGKPAKYLTAGRTVLDVPDVARPLLRDANTPLWITEGIKKVDSAVCHDLPCTIGVQGVWMYRKGKDRTALPDWDDIDLMGRSVIIAYDSDVMRKAGPRGALEALAGYLAHRGATVRFCLMPDLPDGAKCGLDDAFASGLTRASLEAMIADALPDAEPEWDEPIPLDDPAGPALPVEALPPVMANIVEGVARQVQAPADLAFVAALGAVSAAIGGKYLVTPDGHWREPAHVMTIGVAPPSTGKSPIFTRITKSLADWQAAQAERLAPQIAAWESEYRILERQLAAAEKERGAVSREGRATDGVAVWQAALTDFEAHRQHKPVAPLASVGDVTPEQAARLLYEQGGALAVLSPESPFLSNTIGGRYSDSPNVDLILNGYSGERIDRHRVGGDGFTVDRGCLTLAVMVQPAVITAMGKVPETTGRGVSARLLPVIPASAIGTRTYGSRVTIPAGTITAWNSSLTRLLDVHREGEPRVMHLSPDAERRFGGFWDEVERRILADGQDMAEWRGKLPGQVLRIAGLFHVLEHASPEQEPVSLETVARAITVGEYFEAHAQIMFSLVHGARGVDSQAKQMLDAIRELADGDGKTTKREVHRKEHRRFARADDLDAPLATLEAYGWVRLDRDGKSTTITLNPLGSGDNGDSARLPAKIEHQLSPLSPVFVEPESIAAVVSLDDHRIEPLAATGTDDEEWGHV